MGSVFRLVQTLSVRPGVLVMEGTGSDLVGPEGPAGDTGPPGPPGMPGTPGTPGSAADSLVKTSLSNISLLATSTTLIVPASGGKRFIPTELIIEIKSVTGTPGTYPVIRVGNNVNYDNAAPLFIVSGIGLHEINEAPLVVPVESLDIDSDAIYFDVQTAGAGGSISVLTADIQLLGVVK